MIQTLTLRTVVCQGLRSEKPSISPKNGCWKFFQPDFLPNFSVTYWNDWFLKNHPSLFCFSNDFNRLVKIGQSGWRWMVFRNFWQFCYKIGLLIFNKIVQAENQENTIHQEKGGQVSSYHRMHPLKLRCNSPEVFQLNGWKWRLLCVKNRICEFLMLNAVRDSPAKRDSTG